MYKKENDIRVDLKKLHPCLQWKIKKLLKKCNKKGMYIAITEGYRSRESQDSLYSKGRTTKGSIVTYAKGSDYASQHQWGIAFDIGIPATTTAEFYNGAKIRQIAVIAKKLGLGWGGDWIKPVDTPHFYLKKWGSTTATLKKLYGNVTNFKKTWTAKTTKKVKKIPKGKTVRVLYIKINRAKIEYNGKYYSIPKKYLK